MQWKHSELLKRTLVRDFSSFKFTLDFLIVMPRLKFSWFGSSFGPGLSSCSARTEGDEDSGTSKLFRIRWRFRWRCSGSLKLLFFFNPSVSIVFTFHFSFNFSISSFD